MQSIWILWSSIYNLIECSNNYAKTSKILSQYHTDIPNDNKQNSEPFKFKEKITGATPVHGNTNTVEIEVSLNYLIIFPRALKMHLISSWNAFD